MSILALALAFLQQTPAAPQLSDAQLNYEFHCKSCHEPGQPGVPDRADLRKMPADAIVRSLDKGNMKAMGATLTPDQRRAIADFIRQG